MHLKTRFDNECVGGGGAARILVVVVDRRRSEMMCLVCIVRFLCWMDSRGKMEEMLIGLLLEDRRFHRLLSIPSLEVFPRWR